MDQRDPFDARDPFEAPDARDLPSDGDAIEHLWNAAHEMLRAMRTVLDAADEFVASQRGARPPTEGESDARSARAGRVHHIDIDVRAEPDTTGARDAEADTEVM
jgi:hypothetical protein